MPLLDLAALEAMRATPPHICETCGRAVNPNYCRTCDEFFEAGHLGVGACVDAVEHDSHRTY